MFVTQVDELHGPLACKGNSALMIACRAEKLDILCPVGAVSFVRMTSEQNSNVYEAADTDLDETFKFPHKPGIKPPPVESTVLLILAECVWFGFGRRLLVCEMLGVYTPWIGLLTWITVSRGTLDDWVQGNLCAVFPYRIATTAAARPLTSICAAFESPC